MMLEPEVLDKIYRYWRKTKRTSPYTPSRFDDMITYQRRYRNGANSEFEAWLWQQGFTVVQKDKQRHLRFSGDGKQLTFFLLKYGGR